MTFPLLIIYRKEVEWVDYIYISRSNRDQSDGQEKHLNIEIVNNFEAIMF